MLKSHHSQAPSFHEVDKGVLILKSGAPHQSKAPSSQFRVVRVLILKSGALPDLIGLGLGTECKLQRIRAPNHSSANSTSEFRRQAHFRLQPRGRPNLSFREFERRISASGTASASAWWQTEFKLQRIGGPHFGVRHSFGFRLGADRI